MNTAAITEPARQSTSTSAITPAETLRDLVAAPSVTGDESRAVQCFARAAEALGCFHVEIDDAGSAIATRPAADPTAPDACEIILLGHIDTVPGDIPVRIEGDLLYGRGAVDAKGPLTAMLFGAARAISAPNTTLRVVAAVGEESATSPGANAVAARFQPDACIIGEPSGAGAVTLGYKGRILATLSVETNNAHSAGPDLSPADVAFAWLRNVHERSEAHNEGRDRVFDQIQCTVQSMHTSTDGLTRRCDITLGLRLPRAISPDDIERALHADLDSLNLADAVDATLHCEGAEQAWVVDRTDPVVQSISAAIGMHGDRPRAIVKTGTADLNVVAPIWRCPIAAYGPGDSALDHTPNEHISLAELDRAVQTLADALPILAEILISQRARD